MARQIKKERKAIVTKQPVERNPLEKKKRHGRELGGGAHLGALVHGTLNPPDPLHPHAAF